LFFLYVDVSKIIWNFSELFRAFVAADVDFDGKVSVEEFDSMIEAAAALPR
jgi:hypothetical protein